MNYAFGIWEGSAVKGKNPYGKALANAGGCEFDFNLAGVREMRSLLIPLHKI